MPCAAPIPAWRPAIGGPLIFNPPTKRQGRAYNRIDLPCGYCDLCREEQARQQAVRIVHEAQCHEQSAFITLTYAPKHEPPYRSLRYEDLIKFWKRVRKYLWKTHHIKLRYYAVGEYGDESLNPHYHACVFGHAFVEDRIIIRTTPSLLWTSPVLSRAWGLGYVSVGALNFQTARYTASYVLKKQRRKQNYVRVDEETAELIKLEQPRAFMSKNLAKQWWLENRHHVTAHDFVVIDGRKQKPPRAYDRWLGEQSKIAKEIQTNVRIENSVRKTAEQTHARARNARARAQKKSKSV